MSIHGRRHCDSSPQLCILSLVCLVFLMLSPLDAQDVNKARELAVQGNNYFKQGDLVKAIELYTQSAAAHPRYLSAYYQRSICYLQLGQYYQAHEDMTYVLEIFSGDTQVGGGSREQAVSLIQSMRGAVGLALGRYTEAIGDARKAVEMWPVNPMANIVLGQALGIQGDPAQAEEFYLKAKSVAGPATFTNPLDVHVGIVLSKIAAGDNDGALKAAEALRSELPAEEAAGWALEVVARAVKATGPDELDTALDLLQKKAQKSNYRLLAEGILYRRLGRNEAALASLREFERTPFYLLARQTRGELELQAGNVERARSDLEPLMAVNPKVEESVRNLPGASEFVASAKQQAKETVGKTVAERRSEDEQRIFYNQVSSEIRSALRMYRFGPALNDAKRLRDGLTSKELKDRAGRLVDIVDRGRVIFTRLLEAINKGSLKNRQLQIGETSATVVSATEDTIKLEFQGGQGAWSWSAFPMSRFFELASRLTLDGKDWMTLGELTFTADEVSFSEQSFVKAFESKESQKEVSRRYAQMREAPEPAGGFKAYKGKVVTAEQRRNLDAGLVEYEGQWVTPEDRRHLRQGHQKVKGKWLSLTENQLKARGCTKVNDEWLTADEVRRMRGEWNSGWEKETSHFSIKTNRSDEFAQRLAELSEAAYAEFERFFGERSKGGAKLRLYAFARFEDYQKYCKDISKEDMLAAAGFAPSEAHTACGWDKLSDEMTFLQTMIHEATHLYFWEKTQTNVPNWIAEGMATYFEGFHREGGTWKFDHLAAGRLTFLRKAISDRNFMSLSEFLGSDPKQLISTDSTKALVFYSECWALFYFFQNTANQGYRDRFKKFFDKVEHGAGVNFEEDLGVDLNALEAEIQEFIKHL